MLEAEHGGVERLAAQCFQGRPYRGAELGFARRKSGSIGRVTQKRMADMRHVNPDLVRPPGFERATDQTGDRLFVRASEGFKQLVAGRRRSPFGLPDHRHFGPVRRLPAD